jgi:phage-related protein
LRRAAEDEFVGLTQCLIYETYRDVLNILRQCQKEILDFPEETRGELADAIARLELGQMLSMPLARPMPSIGKGVHELRFRDRAGIYRVNYLLAGQGSIWLLHGFVKKTQQTPQHNIDIATGCLREVPTK